MTSEILYNVIIEIHFTYVQLGAIIRDGDCKRVPFLVLGLSL